MDASPKMLADYNEFAEVAEGTSAMTFCKIAP
jgi:hypothetical protein